MGDTDELQDLKAFRYHWSLRRGQEKEGGKKNGITIPSRRTRLAPSLEEKGEGMLAAFTWKV